jgi:hypothetical protein
LPSDEQLITLQLSIIFCGQSEKKRDGTISLFTVPFDVELLHQGISNLLRRLFVVVLRPTDMCKIFLYVKIVMTAFRSFELLWNNVSAEIIKEIDHQVVRLFSSYA